MGRIMADVRQRLLQILKDAADAAGKGIMTAAYVEEMAGWTIKFCLIIIVFLSIYNRDIYYLTKTSRCIKIHLLVCGYGGIGRRARLRI